MKIIDRNYLSPKILWLSFNIYKLFSCFLEAGDLWTQSQCLELGLKPKYELFSCESLFNKKLSTKRVHPLIIFIARQTKQMSPSFFFYWKICGHFGQTVRKENALLLTGNKAVADFPSWWSLIFAYRGNFTTAIVCSIRSIWIRPLLS